MRAGPLNGSPSRRRSALRSGLLTGLSLAVMSGTAAAVGALLAHKFGRTAETDGFLAAYGVYLVLVLAAQSFRVVVVPDLTRAAASGRLATETRAYLVSFVLAAAAVSVVAGLLRHPIADAITGSLPDRSSEVAAEALVYLVPAAFAQLLAALAASALAARDDYGLAAFAYAAGGVAGLVCFVVLADAHGTIALAWAAGLNGAISFGIPLGALLLRGELAGGSLELRVPARLWRLAQGSAVPIAIQGLYLVCLRFAADRGIGSVTSFSYAYLIAAVFVAVTAASVALISSAPTSAAASRRSPSTSAAAALPAADTAPHPEASKATAATRPPATDTESRTRSPHAAPPAAPEYAPAGAGPRWRGSFRWAENRDASTSRGYRAKAPKGLPRPVGQAPRPAARRRPAR